MTDELTHLREMFGFAGVVKPVEKKYNPDQPRAPKGNSDGGQWTDDPAAGDDPGTRQTSLAPQANGGYYSKRERDLMMFLDADSLDDEAYEQRREDLKMAGASALAADGVSAENAASIQAAWSNTSNDHGGWQDALQVEAFDRSATKDGIQTTKGMDAAREARRKSPKKTQDAKAAYDSIYRRTQEYFREKGLKPDDEIVLYRGVKMGNEWGDTKVGEKVRINPRPISSWSLSYDAAKYFATPGRKQVGIVFAVKVPVKSIFAHAATGYGSSSEEECVVLGDGLLDREMEAVRINK